MKSFVRPLQLGNLKLPCNAAFSPLAGVSDYPFRKMARKYFPGLIFCEMVKMDALVRNDINTYRLLDYSSDMHPIGAQLCGSKPEYAAPCARIIEDLGFDVLDLNCGCPVDKVTKDGSGSGLLRHPEKIGELLLKLTGVVDIPVTVKVRAGWDEDSINVKEVTKIAEQAGAKAIFIHGRTRQQAYRGPANWGYIKDAVSVKRDILIFGNGDIINEEAAEKVFTDSGCDGILLSRATMGNPAVYQKMLTSTKPNALEFLQQHLKYIEEYASGRSALINLRRVACWYLKALPQTKKLREMINRSKRFADAKAAIETFMQETEELVTTT